MGTGEYEVVREATVPTPRQADGATHVTWRMVGPMTFMTRVMGIFKSMDKMIGPDFEKGLTRLRGAAQA